VGYTYRDSASRTRVDAYIYPLSPENEVLGTDSARLAHEAELFAQALAIRERQGALEAYSVTIDRPLEPSQSRVPGRVVVAVWRERGIPFVSFMHVFAFAGTLLKVRLTLPADRWQTSTAPNFALDLVRALSEPQN
jgi:hypothetical protein